LKRGKVVWNSKTSFEVMFIGRAAEEGVSENQGALKGVSTLAGPAARALPHPAHRGDGSGRRKRFLASATSIAWPLELAQVGAVIRTILVVFSRP